MKLSLLARFIAFLVLVVISAFPSSRERRETSGNEQDVNFTWLQRIVHVWLKDILDSEEYEKTFNPWDFGSTSHIARNIDGLDEILKSLTENSTVYRCHGCCDGNVSFNLQPRNGERGEGAGMQLAHKNIPETKINLTEALGRKSNSTSDRCQGCCSFNATHFSVDAETATE